MIENLKEFLFHAVRLESDAAEGYDRLAEQMRATGKDEVAAMFQKFSEFSRLHKAEVEARFHAAGGTPGEEVPSAFRWPDGHSPENPRAVPLAADLNARQAIGIALQMERQACDFYSAVANQSRNAEVQDLAQLFTEEESQHVNYLERWLARATDGQETPGGQDA